MGQRFIIVDKFLRSKALTISLLVMAIASSVFHPVFNLKRRQRLRLQEAIKESNKDRLTNFGGTSIERVE